MKKAIIILLVCSVVSFGQQRSLPPERVLPGPTGTVTLSLLEYNRLVELAAKKPKPPEPPPLPFMISRAAFTLKADSDAISGSMNIEGEVLRKGPTKIPVSSGLFVTGAQQSQKPVPLMEDASRHSVVVTGPGGFGVSLTVASQLIVEAGRASFVLNVP